MCFYPPRFFEIIFFLLLVLSSIRCSFKMPSKGYKPVGRRGRYVITLCLVLFALPLASIAQEVKVLEDEKCGCDIFLVDGIETTRDGDRYGFRYEDGTVIVPNIYRFVGQFNQGYCKVMLNYDSTGLIDRTGRLVVPCIYSDVDIPAEGRILVVKNGLTGYTDLNGHEVIPPRFPNGGCFTEGCAPVYIGVDSLGVRCNFIDTLGRYVFPTDYSNVQPFSEGYAPVSLNGLWGMIDHSGRIVLPIMYEVVTNIVDGIFFAGSSGALAMFNTSMEPITDFVYDEVNDPEERRVLVSRNDKYGFLDLQGHEVVPCIYDETGVFRLGRTLARLGNHYGIIDTNGGIVLPIEYDSYTPKGMKYMYYDSLALVEKDGKLGYVDLQGNLVIPFYFDEAFEFSEGLAAALFQGHWGYIDTKGDIFMPFIFDAATPYSYGRAEVVYNSVTSKVNRKGKCVRNCNGIIAWRDWQE